MVTRNCSTCWYFGHTNWNSIQFVSLFFLSYWWKFHVWCCRCSLQCIECLLGYFQFISNKFQLLWNSENAWQNLMRYWTRYLEEWVRIATNWMRYLSLKLSADNHSHTLTMRNRINESIMEMGYFPYVEHESVEAAQYNAHVCMSQQILLRYTYMRIMLSGIC